MDNVSFVIDGIKYIATYKDDNLKILKLENNNLQELTPSENKNIYKGTDKNTIKFQEIKSKYSKRNNEITYKHI